MKLTHEGKGAQGNLTLLWKLVFLKVTRKII